MAWNGVATPVALTPITVAFFATNVKENLEDHEVRIGAIEADLPILPETLDAVDSPADTEVPAYDAATQKFKWVVGFPSGVGGWVRKASEIPAGFSRESDLDGRIPVGAGTTFTVTYVEETNYGASWSHGHTGGTHTHSGADLGIGGTMGGPDRTVTKDSGGTNAAAQDHVHDNGSLDVSGNTSTGGVVATSTDAWVIPSRAVVWIRKN